MSLREAIDRCDPKSFPPKTGSAKIISQTCRVILVSFFSLLRRNDVRCDLRRRRAPERVEVKARRKREMDSLALSHPSAWLSPGNIRNVLTFPRDGNHRHWVVRAAFSQRAFVHGRVKKEGSKSEITNDVHEEDGLPVAAAMVSFLWQGPTWRRESRIRDDERREQGSDRRRHAPLRSRSFV
jgi:hypothetical protein